MQRRKSVSRIFELIVGGLGALVSLVSSSFILLIGSFGFGATSFLGLIATLGSFLGIFASIHVLKIVMLEDSCLLFLQFWFCWDLLSLVFLEHCCCWLQEYLLYLENKNFLNKAFVNKQLIFKRFYFSQFAGEVYGLI
mgnify:CR=1 FL=1